VWCCRLVARWLLLLVSPSGQPQLPLPEQVRQLPACSLLVDDIGGCQLFRLPLFDGLQQLALLDGTVALCLVCGLNVMSWCLP